MVEHDPHHAGGLPWREFALEKFGGEERMEAALAHVSAAGVSDGIHFRFDRVASAPNTVDAHRLIPYAAERGLEWEMAESLFEAYFSEGANLNDREELTTVASGVGLVPEEARAYLDGVEGADEVWRSQEEASRHRGRALLRRGRPVRARGAQPVEVFLRAFDLAHAG
jgi:predicted DsbA family dithiol-disulfide isomerase